MIYKSRVYIGRDMRSDDLGSHGLHDEMVDTYSFPENMMLVNPKLSGAMRSSLRKFGSLVVLCCCIAKKKGKLKNQSQPKKERWSQLMVSRDGLTARSLLCTDLSIRKQGP